jgi:amino acid adenylation domain-containing protein
MQSCESVARSQRQAFHKLLRHAWLNSPFYRDLYSSTGIKYSALGEVTPSDLPLIDKKVLMDNFDRAVTDTRLRKRDLERWMYENRNPAASYLNEFVVFHSSGTSGSAGVFVYRQTERRFAGSIVASHLPPPANYGNGRTKAAFCILAHDNLSAVSRAVRMPSSLYETLILSVLDSPEVVARNLNDFQPHQLHGYASTIHQLSRHALSGKLKISPQRIFVGGDKLTTGMAMAIRRAWDVPIYEFYTASESGCIAVRESNDAAMKVLAELNLLEVPDAENRGTEDDRSGRLVLTNLYNHTLPIIRYSLGDEVTLGKPTDHAPAGTIKNLEGRAHDRLSVTLRDGCEEAIEGIVFVSLYVPGLERFQIISVRPDFVRIEYVATDDLNSTLRLEFQRILDSKGAAGTKFEIHRVTQIEIDPQTGKSPLIRTQHDAILDWPQEPGGTGEQPWVAWGSRQGPSPDETKQPLRRATNLPLEQEAIRAKCFHPTGKFVKFPEAAVGASIPERFEKIVRLYPQRQAVKCGDRCLTYELLNQTANRIARTILALRGPGSEPIALLFEHDAEVIAAILGVLKAGKFYIALSPSFPAARNHYMLNDSQTRMIVTNTGNFGPATELSNDERIVLNIHKIDDAVSSDNINPYALPDDLAAIRYTSGSTGEPKGVAETHRKILHQARLTTNDELHICAKDRLTLLHSVSFGSAYPHLYGSLLNGACLLPFDVKSQGMHNLADWVKKEAVTIYKSPPQVFRQLAESLPVKTKLPRLRLIHLSGAPITQLDFDLYKKKFATGLLLEISMGATEVRGICFALLDRTFAFPQEGAPIGYPRRGRQILLLDECGREVEPGQVGEIAVKGRNLTLGYWRNAELTDSKIAKNSSTDGEQIYLTGDLGRRMPDGMMIHLGRKDLMVKIRGYRVDLTEIERALLRHRQIREAAVMAWNRDASEKKLVAYIVCDRQAAPTVNELYEFLRDKIPDYMLPASFIVMDSLPVSNGKLERTALPEPDNARPALAVPLVRPRNSIEAQLAKIWAEVLGMDDFGIHDNFFDLGGHSLAATRVVSRVIENFQLDLSMKFLFDSPTVAEMALVISQNKTEQVGEENVEPRTGFSDGVDQKIPARSTGNSLPLSFTQQRLWFLRQLMPESPSYNLCSAYQITGQLDVPALEQSFNELIKRHEILRTVFKAVDGQPVQVILPSMTLKLPVIDLRGIDSDFDKQSEISRLSIEEAQRLFDFAHGPLLRMTLLRLTDDRYVLLRAIHHIIFDGWSLGILNSELSEIYKSLTRCVPAHLPELSVQYADYSVWQRAWLQGEVLETQLTYWKKQLRGLPTLQLPTDRPRPVIQSSHGARQHFELSETLCEGLKDLAKRHGATLFMVLVTAFQTLLHRYTGQDDVAIGSAVAGRNRREFENLLGFFLNTLVLRGDLAGNPTFVELLARARTMCLDAALHQDIPFEKLVEELNPVRDLSRHPLIQVTFAFQNTPQFPLLLSGLDVRDLKIETGIAIFDLHLFMVEEAGRLPGYFVYNTDLFDAGTITRLIGHFQNLLEAVVADPDQRISQLPILTDTERRQVVIKWNETKRHCPKDKCLHQLFEEQVKQTPESVAVIFEDQELSYEELNARANQLAHYLKKFGVGPETLVAICMEQSLEMIVGLVGILKAGGAYLPIDPEFPRERIQFMLHDSQASFLLTQARLDEFIPSFTGKRIIIDRDWPEIACENTANLDQRHNPDSLAYVIYTSGSTGIPKGVMIPHRGVVNLLASMAREFGLTQSDIFLAVTTLSFDIAGLEIYLPLVLGARVVIASRKVAADAVRLIDLLSHSGASVMQATPATWQMLMAAGLEGNQKLKVLCGGEALSEPLAKELIGRSSMLWNLYGPTETTIWSATQRIREHVGRVTIGRPIANTQIYILDSFLNPVPIGVIGELHIGGAGLAQGYLNRPELTAEKFIPNPFTADRESRLYKTGDLGRFLPDGSIEFLGRIDDQVKIRGYRIELGEIEAVLGRCPGVDSSAVVALEAAPMDKRLVAYVTVHESTRVGAQELRGYLKEKLPAYMVPSAFVFLDALPQTASGKLDRARLPAPDPSEHEPKDAYQPPRTQTEQVLAVIWGEILKLDRVGIEDNFFDLGGHSLLATQVVSRIRNAFAIDLPLRHLFASPTIVEIAAILDRNRVKHTSDIALARIPRRGRRRPESREAQDRK